MEMQTTSSRHMWCDLAEWLASVVSDGADREFCWRCANVSPQRWTEPMRDLFALIASEHPQDRWEAPPAPPGLPLGDPHGDASRAERAALKSQRPLIRMDTTGVLAACDLQPPGTHRTDDPGLWRASSPAAAAELIGWADRCTPAVPVTASVRAWLHHQTGGTTSPTSGPLTPGPTPEVVGGFVDHIPGKSLMIVTVDYHPEVSSSLREIRGSKWVSKEEHWEVPDREADRVLELADKWMWVVTDTARAIGERAGFVRTEAVRMSKAVDADLYIPELNPDMKLRPFQLAGVAYVIAKRRTFISDEVGLGKTPTSLAACAVAGRRRIVVIAKASLLENWLAEVHKWFPTWDAAIVTGRKEQPLPDVRVVIIGYPVIAWRWGDINNWEPDALILDESHMCKTPGSFERYNPKTKKMTPKKGTQATAAAKAISKPVRARDGLIMLLTATPIQNKKYIEWWSQLEILGQEHLFGDWTAFIKRHCDGRREFGHWVADGATHGEELHQVLRENCFVRRRKADVLEDLPPWEAIPIRLPFSPEGAKAYKKAEDDIVAFLMERARQIAEELGENADRAAWLAKIRAESAEHLVKVNALRRIAGESKLPAVMDWVDEFLLDPEKKLIVFAHHREVQAACFEAWREKYQAAAILTAEEQAKVGEPAEQSKQRFQTDQACRLILCGPGAKEGHTLTAADTVLVAELPWVPTDLTQMVGRAWGRLSDLHGAQLIAPLGGADDSIDHRMWGLLQEKQEAVDAATDGIIVDDGSKIGSILGDLIVGWVDGGRPVK